jgi:UDP-3-O-[3-hydroxymyristoyl] glucosamine N-acyltransferase
MKLDQPVTLAALAKFLQCEHVGDADFLIHGLNEIHRVEAGDLVFVDHPKYYDKALQSAATTILINKEVECPAGKALLISSDPCRDYNRLTQHYCPWEQVDGQRGKHQIGSGSRVHASVIIGNHVSIGKDCIIHPGVVLYDHVHIGDRCIIHANAVIGSDAFYYKARPEGREKMHSCGSVVIEDDVEIGASCTIDKGVSGDTVIGRGTKFDNQIHIGHDTVVGEDCLFAAQVGVAGVATIENRVILWGQVGVSKDLTIGEGAVVLAQSGVPKSLAAGQTYFGSPVGEAKSKMREMAYVRQIPDILKELKK